MYTAEALPWLCFPETVEEQPFKCALLDLSSGNSLFPLEARRMGLQIRSNVLSPPTM